MKYNDEYVKEVLQKAFPEHKAQESFKDNLRYKLLNYSEEEERRNSMQNRKWLPRWVYTGGSVAAILIILFFTNMMLFQKESSIKDLPLLPSVEQEIAEIQGASAGPGFKVEIDYIKKGVFESFPDQAKVFEYNNIYVNKTTVKETAEKLNIQGEVTKEPWQDTYTYRVGSMDNKSLVVFPNGFYNYNSKMPKNISTEKKPDESELIQEAELFLEELNINTEEIKISGIEHSYNNKPLTADITFTPDIGNQISTAPYITVTMATDKQVCAAKWEWPRAKEVIGDYPLMEVEEAWSAVKSGKGSLAIDYSKVPFPEEGNTVKGIGNIDKVTLGYILTSDNNSSVFQPVAAFKGTAMLNNIEVPFTVYTKIIQPNYY